MDKPLRRTSVTVDEAVAIMMRWADGPIEYTDIDNEYDFEIPAYDIRQVLAEELDSLTSAYAEAKYDKQAQSVLDERLAVLQKQREDIRQANTFLCAIEDELNRGEHSALRVDTKRSNNVLTYITLTSLKEWMQDQSLRLSSTPASNKTGEIHITLTSLALWAKQLFEISGLSEDVDSGMAAAVAPLPAANSEVPSQRRKQRDQEEAILQEIQNLGFDPQKLPKPEPGKAGVKASVKKKLEGNSLFTSAKIFDKAWERLRGFGEIAEM
jgi:hypothetical protein